VVFIIRVKACGIRNKKDANACIASGVDALGFLMGITHKAEDEIMVEDARDIISKLPPFISAVAVTHLTDINKIASIVKGSGANTLQLQGDIRNDSITFLRNMLPGIKIIKCVHVKGISSLDDAIAAQGYVDAIILDTKTEDRLGGTGLTHDWAISKEIVKKVNKPVILAGGLNPCNVSDAIKIVAPFAVDANSGLDDKDGNKDKSLVCEFVARAKNSLS
jgi:phosphoribosylanthranilate isomerase